MKKKTRRRSTRSEELTLSEEATRSEEATQSEEATRGEEMNRSQEVTRDEEATQSEEVTREEMAAAGLTVTVTHSECRAPGGLLAGPESPAGSVGLVTCSPEACDLALVLASGSVGSWLCPWNCLLYTFPCGRCILSLAICAILGVRPCPRFTSWAWLCLCARAVIVVFVSGIYLAMWSTTAPCVMSQNFVPAGVLLIC